MLGEHLLLLLLSSASLHDPGLRRGLGLCPWRSFSTHGAWRFVWPWNFIVGSGRRWGDGVKTGVEGQGEIGYAQTITVGSKPQNIYLFQPNGSIKWTPAMFLAWITVLGGTHKWRAVTPSCSLMCQIQCLPRVQRLSQMLKLFVLVNKLNFTATLSFYHATRILREVAAAGAGGQCQTEAWRRPGSMLPRSSPPRTRGWVDQWRVCLSQEAWLHVPEATPVWGLSFRWCFIWFWVMAGESQSVQRKCKKSKQTPKQKLMVILTSKHTTHCRWEQSLTGMERTNLGEWLAAGPA